MSDRGGGDRALRFTLPDLKNAHTRQAFGRPPSPQGAGLSHMTEDSQEEGIVPDGAFDFAADGCASGMGSQDMEGKPAHSGEVLRSIVLSRAIPILGKMDV